MMLCAGELLVAHTPLRGDFIVVYGLCVCILGQCELLLNLMYFCCMLMLMPSVSSSS